MKGQNNGRDKKMAVFTAIIATLSITMAILTVKDNSPVLQ